MTSRRIAILVAAIAASALPRAVQTQRCAATPSYAPQRTSIGAQFADFNHATAGGAMLRLVRGNTAVEARGNLLRGFVLSDPEAADVDGRGLATAFRRSIPTGDGWTAVCVLVELSRQWDEFRSPGQSLPFDRRTESVFAVGLGYAMPAPIAPDRKATVMYEVRLSRHWRANDDGYANHANWWEREVAVTAGVSLPRNFTATARVAVALFPRESEGPPEWHTARAPRLRLGLMYHLDPPN